MKMKACKNCGNLFPAKGRKTLCDDCKNYLSRAVMRPCRKCGTMFLAEGQRRVCDTCRRRLVKGTQVTCKLCGAVFVGRPNRTLCDDCRSKHSYVSKNTPFTPYKENSSAVRCEICGAETTIRRAYGNTYCQKCGALVYSAWIDNPKYKKD